MSKSMPRIIVKHMGRAITRQEAAMMLDTTTERLNRRLARMKRRNMGVMEVTVQRLKELSNRHKVK